MAKLEYTHDDDIRIEYLCRLKGWDTEQRHYRAVAAAFAAAYEAAPQHDVRTTPEGLLVSFSAQADAVSVGDLKAQAQLVREAAQKAFDAAQRGGDESEGREAGERENVVPGGDGDPAAPVPNDGSPTERAEAGG
jgi:hypothetical protein